MFSSCYLHIASRPVTFLGSLPEQQSCATNKHPAKIVTKIFMPFRESLLLQQRTSLENCTEKIFFPTHALKPRTFSCSTSEERRRQWAYLKALNRSEDSRVRVYQAHMAELKDTSSRELFYLLCCLLAMFTCFTSNTLR